MKATKKETETNNLQQDDNIDKIRDILFGVQVKDFEDKFQKLEGHFSKELAKNRKEIDRRLDSLEELVKKEVASLGERIYLEQDSRSDAIKGVTEEIKVTSNTLDKEVRRIEESAKKSENELRDNLSKEAKSLSDEIASTHESLSSSLEERASTLEENKADREALSKAFSVIAASLMGPKTDKKKGKK